MPGYVILIAVATEYIRKFGTSDEAKFIEGTLDPDLLAVGSKAKLIIVSLLVIKPI